MSGHGRFELLHEDWHAFAAALAMPDRIVDGDALGGAAILEENLQRVADVALVGRVVVLGKSGVLAHHHR